MVFTVHAIANKTLAARGLGSDACRYVVVNVVLGVGRTSNTPEGGRAPRRVNFSGSLKNSTTSASSSFASSTPATSANFTTCWGSPPQRDTCIRPAGQARRRT
eukprot:1195910-Prorocentrum_minimum.AAC.2